MTGASRFLIGLITCRTTHDGIPAVASATWRRIDREYAQPLDVEALARGAQMSAGSRRVC